MRQISRRDFVKIALGVPTGLSALGREVAVAEESPPRKRPNLLFVFADQMRRHAMGFMNQDPVRTPALDRLAAEGQVLDHAISNTPICSPFRAMLFTGKWPHSTGVVVNCYARPDGWEETERERNCYLRRSERCLSDVLHRVGYATGYIGKWHLSKPKKPYVDPTDHGGYIWDAYAPPTDRHSFDFWYGYGTHGNHLHPHYWTGDAPKDEPIHVDQWAPEHEADLAIEYLKDSTGRYRDPDKPFALFVSHHPPHNPYNAVPDKYLEEYRDTSLQELLNRGNVDLALDEGPTARAKRAVRGYFAMVTGVDDQLGRILRCLEEQGLRENTIVVFTADHGEMMGSHNRMAKSVWYEESVGIPFIIRWPSRIEPGRDDLLLSVPDYMPTLLGLMGLSDEATDGVEGTDYSPALLGENMARPTSAPYLSIRHDGDEYGARGLRTHRHTFVVRRTKEREETILYDNEKDPCQLENVAERETSLTTELREELEGWQERTRDPWART
jgi:arylsulfatase A-like enzyme